MAHVKKFVKMIQTVPVYAQTISKMNFTVWIKSYQQTIENNKVQCILSTDQEEVHKALQFL